MQVTNARTKKAVALSRPSQMFGQDKTVMDEGFAGDVIGLNNPGSFAIGREDPFVHRYSFIGVVSLIFIGIHRHALAYHRHIIGIPSSFICISSIYHRHSLVYHRYSSLVVNSLEFYGFD